LLYVIFAYLDGLKEKNVVKLATVLNMALCLIKLNEPDESLKMCEEALKIDPSSNKGLFRQVLITYFL
jgi:hypothetical protein